MRLMLEYSEFSEVNAESATRTKKLTEERFLEILYKYCKNFSFENDQLWRNANQSFGQFGIFFEKDRARTIGTYSYKDFFDERCGYLVPRYKSLIGSTDIKGSDIFGSGSRNYLVIPFDDANIITRRKYLIKTGPFFMATFVAIQAPTILPAASSPPSK